MYTSTARSTVYVIRYACYAIHIYYMIRTMRYMNAMHNSISDFDGISIVRSFLLRSSFWYAKYHLRNTILYILFSQNKINNNFFACVWSVFQVNTEYIDDISMDVSNNIK